MTYKLNPAIAKISSPVTLFFPSGVRHEYSSGTAVAEQAFNERYRVTEIRATGDVVEINLELMTVPEVNAIGEETFF